MRPCGVRLPGTRCVDIPGGSIVRWWAFMGPLNGSLSGCGYTRIRWGGLSRIVPGSYPGGFIRAIARY